MVAIKPEYLAELVGPGRVGFIATNGLHDSVVIDDTQENEYLRYIRDGWRVEEIRPICRSLNPKLIHTREELQGARVYSYVLVILAHPARIPSDTRRALGSAEHGASRV
jgi:hypothetical protein